MTRRPSRTSNPPLALALALAAACALWGIDNNLTQRLTLRDPFVLVRGKTLGAGLVSQRDGRNGPVDEVRHGLGERHHGKGRDVHAGRTGWFARRQRPPWRSS